MTEELRVTGLSVQEVADELGVARQALCKRPEVSAGRNASRKGVGYRVTSRQRY